MASYASFVEDIAETCCSFVSDKDDVVLDNVEKAHYIDQSNVDYVRKTEDSCFIDYNKENLAFDFWLEASFLIYYYAY